MFSPINKVRLFVRALAALTLFAVPAIVPAQGSELAGDSAESKVVVGFVVYNAGTFRRGLERSVKIFSSVIDGLNVEDAGFILTFAGTEAVSIKTDITRDKLELKDLIENIYVEPGSGALWDSIILSAQHLSASNLDPETRKILLVVTDGDDRASSTNASTAIKFLKEHNIRLIVLGVADGQLITRTVDRLTKDSGGAKVVPPRDEAPDTTAQAIISQIRAIK